MRNFMRNHRDKGYPDSDHVKYESSLSSSSILTPISETPPQHSASSSALTPSRPSGYPHTNNQPAAWINQDTHNNSLIHPPTAYRYAAHQVRSAQVGHRKVSVPVLPAAVGRRDQMESVNTGFPLKVDYNKNLNKDASQKITTSQSGGLASLFKYCRVYLVAGCNVNLGNTQKIGDVELLNDNGHRGFRCSIM